MHIQNQSRSIDDYKYVVKRAGMMWSWQRVISLIFPPQPNDSLAFIANKLPSCRRQQHVHWNNINLGCSKQADGGSLLNWN